MKIVNIGNGKTKQTVINVGIKGLFYNRKRMQQVLDYTVENKNREFIFRTPKEIWVILYLLKHKDCFVLIYDDGEVLNNDNPISYKDIDELSFNNYPLSYTEALYKAYLKSIDSTYDSTNDLDFLAECDCLINPTLR